MCDLALLACDRGRTSPPRDASGALGGRLAITYGEAQVLVWDLETDSDGVAASQSA